MFLDEIQEEADADNGRNEGHNEADGPNCQILADQQAERRSAFI